MSTCFAELSFVQVVYSDKEKLRALYLQGDTKQTQDEWIQCIRLGKTIFGIHGKGTFSLLIHNSLNSEIKKSLCFFSTAKVKDDRQPLKYF